MGTSYRVVMGHPIKKPDEYMLTDKTPKPLELILQSVQGLR